MNRRNLFQMLNYLFTVQEKLMCFKSLIGIIERRKDGMLHIGVQLME